MGRRTPFVTQSMRPVLLEPTRLLSTSRHAKSAVADPVPAVSISKGSPLSRMPTKTLVRSLVLTSLMGKDWLLRPSLVTLSFICKSKSVVFNPDKNPILRQAMRWSLYNHFASGTNAAEVARSIKEFKSIGYQGIILGYAKEIVLENPKEEGKHVDGDRYTPAEYRMVEEWKQGTLETLHMIGPHDILSVKITGAGPIAVDAMKAHEPMPKVIADAMDEICVKTQEQSSRLWIDAEQQALQPTLDEWTISLMQKFNRGDRPLVFNTIQAYLKGARDNANRHIIQAAKEGWCVAIKLVRGAYIDNEVRSLIHDTKEHTDNSYDSIVNMLLSQEMPEGHKDLEFPRTALFLATHNAESAEKAIATYCKRSSAGLPTATLECGQIQGMADELSCALLQRYEEYTRDPDAGRAPPPGVFKYQIWGSISECMGYLYRRAVENRGAVERTEHMVVALKKELRRRILG